MTRSKYIIIAIFAAAALLRLADTFRPINHGSWRECDIGSISRNFVREGLNPLYPRIDWRGAGPGYAEMEFPAYPWLIAVSYEVFGEHEVIGRLWALAFSLGTLFFFFRLAREDLGPFSSIAAFTFFAFNPLILESSTSLQPEGLMIMTYVGAAYFFLRWLRDDRGRDFWLALLLTVITLLAKATAAHIGLLFGVLLLQKYDLSVIKQSRVWLFGLLAVLPAELWYGHAKSLWRTYGNSLGVSNEYHWIGRDFFTNPHFITGILRNEAIYVWALAAFVIAVFGLGIGFREQIAKIAVIWLASAFLLYLVAARTTADDWASYYHIFSVAPAALLFGFGLGKLGEFARRSADSFSSRGLAGNLVRLCLLLAIGLIAISALLVEAKAARTGLLERRSPEPAFKCAEKIKPSLKKAGLILASGGYCRDADGYARAYNASFMFYWLDRKGFNICVEEQSIEHVRDLATKGAVYFVAQKVYLDQKLGLADQLKAAYPLAGECDEFYVFDLSAGR